LAILRPNRPREAALFDGDDLPTTKHFGAFRFGELVGIASLFLAECPELPVLKPAMQLRGMATTPEVRGQGFGRALVMACLAHAQQNAMRLLWCNARCEAAEFYRKLQFEIVGDQFEIPDVGPHFRMFRRI